VQKRVDIFSAETHTQDLKVGNQNKLKPYKSKR